MASLIFLSNPSQAATIALAANGSFSSSYNEHVANLKPGDTIQINGREFKLERYLGDGAMARVWSIGGGRAIRLIKRYGPVPCQDILTPMYDLWSDYAKRFAKGGAELARLEMPVVKIFEAQAPFFTIVEELEAPLTARQWLSEGDPADPELRQAWDKFVEKTQILSRIGDLKLESIVFVKGRGWLLLDFASPITIKEHESQWVFDDLEPPDARLLQKLE